MKESKMDWHLAT